MIKIILAILPLLLSIIFVGGVIYMDEFVGLNQESMFRSAVQCVTPTLLVLFSFFLLPYVVYTIEELQMHDSKSEKEDSYINKFTIFMVINSVVLPFIFSALISSTHSTDEFMQRPKIPEDMAQANNTFPANSDEPDIEFSRFTFSAFNNSEFFIRYIIQIIFFTILY